MVNHMKHRRIFTLIIVWVLFNAGAVLAQTTAFTYQGKLVDNGNPASGNYDLTFKLFDTATVGSGSQQGANLSLTSVAVASGVFAVQLDFGACGSCFNGANRFLEISVKPTSGSTFTTLSPRQPITSTPYTIKSLSAATADGLSVTCVSCVTSSQIQSVTGSAVSGAIPVASVPAGSGNYIQNTTSPQASSNFNISGNGTIGGTLSGNIVNAATQFNIAGRRILSIGNPNFFEDAILIGEGANESSPNLLNATAVGARAFVAQDNSLVLGMINGVNTGYADTKVGIGTSAPGFRLHVVDPSNLGLRVQTNSTGGAVASFGGFGEFQVDANGVPAGRFVVKENGFVGIGTNAPDDKLDVYGYVRLHFLGTVGGTTLCLNNLNQISFCSSSLRYKTNIADWHSGLNLLNRLRPVTFDWKESKVHDLGLVAEEVADAEPLLVTHNDKGEVEGVKYDRISVVLINAIREQQAQITAMQKESLEVKARLATLERVVQQPRNDQFQNANKENGSEKKEP